MVSHHHQNGHPQSKIYQEEVQYRHGIWQIDLITKLRPGDYCHGWSATIPWMDTHYSKDSHPPSPGWSQWSPISHRLVIHYPKYGHQPSQRLSPTFQRMVNHGPKHGHPPSKINEIKKLQLNIEFDTS